MISWRLGCVMATVLCAVACGDSSSDATEGDEQDLTLEQSSIPTGLKELRAGGAYLPGLDESPVASTTNPCLPGAKITNSNGKVESNAAIVQTREGLSRELGLDIGGTIPVLGGLTGAAGIASKTTFDQSSAAVLFHAGGTYESVVSTEAPPAAFDASKVSSCGYGFITRATHRVSAALVVNVRSTVTGSEIRANASLGKADIASVKASLTNIINRGKVEMSLRFATDVIPDMPSAPFGEAALMVDNEADKSSARAKLDASLEWLAKAQTAVEKYLLAVQNEPEKTKAAPTETIKFRFYPSMPTALRSSIEKSSKNALATRQGLGDTNLLIDAWKSFGLASDNGSAFMWQIPGAEVASADQLVSKHKDFLETNGGKLSEHESNLSLLLEGCSLALRNEESNGDAASLAQAIDAACTAPAALPVDRRANAVRPIAIVSVTDTVNDNNRKCGPGTRLPTVAEAKIFEPWSKAMKEKGLWLEDHRCTFGTPWLLDGKPACTSAFGTSPGISVCVSATTGALPKQ